MKGKTLGIIGGGQLGQMTTMAASKMGVKTVIFTDIDGSPAAREANTVIVADYGDCKALQEFADSCDAITYEFENIPAESVELLEKTGKINPSAKILRITQNRILEKTFLNEIGIKTANFFEIRSENGLKRGFLEFGKSILKTATLGYDGKGQFVIENEVDIGDIWREIEAQGLNKHGLVLEKFCPFESEASAIVARSLNGEISCYDPLTNVHKDGILDKSFYPAHISSDCARNIKEIAVKIAEKTGLFGLLAIEFFILEGGELIVNEMAPRPHNSGHFSMDASETSQFEQLILAVFGEKLGDVSFHSHGYMQNLIGDEVLNLTEYENDENARVHVYGKSEVKQGRKMGHINNITPQT